MNKVIVRAPVRADLSGGTLDLWPLYLFHQGSRTVNVAISIYAESEISETTDGAIEIHLTDQQYRARYESLSELASDPKAALIHKAVEHFKLNGLSIVTRTDAPRGSGLGGSSTLTVTLVRALSELAGNPLEGEDLIALVRDLETRLLGIPAGIQDYYPPVYGGLGSIRLDPGRVTRQALQLPIQTLGAHMLLHYSGIAHFSGTNNWELYKRHVDGKRKVRKGLAAIAATSIEMEQALEAGELEAAGAALRKEWSQRKALIDGISTPEIDAAIDAAIGAGAWGGKVCGAGGGGAIVFLLPPDRRQNVIHALSTVPGRILDAEPVAHGMSVIREGEHDATPPLRSRPSAVISHSLEQLYITGGEGDYRPFVLAEGIVKHVEARSGTHHATSRAYIAPIAPEDGQVHWQQASLIDPARFDLRAVPEAGRGLDIEITPEALVRNVARSEEAFRTFLGLNERLQIFHNPAFGLYSEPAETRAAFLERCMEVANREIELRQERLESTFRRRIDQLRERSEKEERQIDENDDRTLKDAQEVNVAWGQALYNITSGKPAGVADPTVSAREGEYLDRIRQIQRSWDRELATTREELTAKARSIEELTITPTEKNIEVTKFVLVWGAGSLVS